MKVRQLRKRVQQRLGAAVLAENREALRCSARARQQRQRVEWQMLRHEADLLAEKARQLRVLSERARRAVQSAL